MNDPATHLNLDRFIHPEDLAALVQRARLEDLGPDAHDVTSLACVPADLTASAHIIPRTAGTLAGVALLPAVVAAYDPAVQLQCLAQDADPAQPGNAVANFRGSKRSILALERVALNLVNHLSGIATLTAAFVEQTRGTHAAICDTRKTLPGLRSLQKYAVACGGGTTHRIGLYDAMLIKDNHLAHLPAHDLAPSLARMIADARQRWPDIKFVEVEVDTLEQLKQVLTLDVDFILLDNMSADTMRRAVAMRNDAAPNVQLEASGNINLQTVRAAALAGVDRISVGALTHSAPSLDLGLDIA